MNKFACVALGLCVAMAAVSRAVEAVDEAEVAESAVSQAVEAVDEAELAESAVSQAVEAADEAELAKALGQEQPGVSGFCEVMRHDVEEFLRSKKGYARLFNLMYKYNDEMLAIDDSRDREDSESPVSEEEHERQLEELYVKTKKAYQDENLEPLFNDFDQGIQELWRSFDRKLCEYKDDELPSWRYLRDSGCALGLRFMSAQRGCLLAPWGDHED